VSYPSLQFKSFRTARLRIFRLQIECKQAFSGDKGADPAVVEQEIFGAKNCGSMGKYAPA
jgi:hypothetical protein